MKRGELTRCALRLLVVAVLVAGLGAAATMGQTKIGELEWISIGSAHPYTPDLDLGSREWDVYHAGATYIRVHFSQFDLAPGDYVEVSDLAGDTVYRYEGKGPHGTGSFWAFTIPGDLARIRLGAKVGYGHGFEIDSYGRGIVEIFDPGQTDSVCGTLDWADVACYQSTEPDKYEAARGAVKAIIGCCSSCTAFKVSDSGQFMTNNHCTSTSSGVQSTQLQMEYQSNGCGSGPSGDSGSVNGSQLVSTDFTLDYTLMTSTGDSSGIPCLKMDNRLPPVGEQIYIAGHPSAGVKKLSIDSDQNAGGLCAVDVSPIAGYGTDSDVGYLCDTTNGSSGSPVLSATNNEVVALHHFGGCFNSGVRTDLILSDLGGQIDSCSVTIGGGTPTCLPKGSGCTGDSQCCSNKCKGGKRGKTCK